MTALFEKLIPQKTLSPIPYELITDILCKVSQDIPETRGQQLTRVYGFPIEVGNCNRDFLMRVVEVPEIVELCNKLYDMDMLTEIYIDKNNWELRIKFSYRDFKAHPLSWRFALAEQSIRNKAKFRKPTSHFG